METAGHFFDGASARRQAVRAVLGAGGLRILAEDGSLLAEWPYGTVRKLESRQGLRLAQDSDQGARLDIDDGVFAAALAGRCGPLRAAGSAPEGWRRITLAVGGAMAVLVGIYLALPWLTGPIAQALPDGWHRRFGEFSAGALQGPRAACTGPGLDVLVNLAERLQPSAERRHPLRLRVVDHGMVNAFSTGGGHVVLARGLIDQAQSADELAGVLAHELAHEQLGHVGQKMVRHMGMAALVSIATGDASGSLAGLASALIELSYSRDDEAAADAQGVAMLARAGIGTDGMAQFFARLRDKHGDADGALALLSSHPPLAERARRVAGQSGKPALDDAQWAAVKAVCQSKG